MRLSKVRVTEFRSVLDSGEFQIGDVTCLVGKNESGKTTLLEALYRLNPIVDSETKFSVTHDYPKYEVEDYLQDVEAGRRGEHTEAINAIFTLDDAEVASVVADFADGILRSKEVSVSRGYDATNKLYIDVPVDEAVAVQSLVKKAGLPNDVAAEASKQKNLNGLQAFLAADGEKRHALYSEAFAKANAIEDASAKATALDDATKIQESQAARTLRGEIPNLTGKRPFDLYVWDTYLEETFPKFLYFDEYYQMTGQVNVHKLKNRDVSKTLLSSDRPMLGLIDLARLKIDDL
jgi:predicted ATP-dependent endonuclease of OLD family